MDEKKVREAIKHLLKKKIALEHKYPRDSNGKIAPNKEYDDVLRSYRIAIEALEKQLAKKPIEVNDAYTPKIGEFRVAKCPNCGHEVSDRFDVCLDCGQNLDWSVKNE